MWITDSAGAGMSGLEHSNSHVDVSIPAGMGSEFQPRLFAHEIFHAWNVKRLRPADLVPYRYDRSQPTPWLWVSEGITDYYADLAMVRGGIVDAPGFYGLTSEKINNIAQAPPFSVEDASLNAWIKVRDGTDALYYDKGSLAGFLLDVMIRDASDNHRSLDTVMRELYRTTYKAGKGFTGTDWWGEVSRAAGGKSFADFNAKYVDGREPYPWAQLLPLAGIKVVTDTVREARLGISAGQDSAGAVVIRQVLPGGPAEEAGVKVGDVLLAIGDIPINDVDFGAKFRSEEHTSELQSRRDLVCRLLLEKKKKKQLTLIPQIRAIVCLRVGANYNLDNQVDIFPQFVDGILIMHLIGNVVHESR